MIDVKPEVYQALSQNQRLFALLGGDRVYHIRAPDANEFPRITYFEVFNLPAASADDRQIASTVQIQVSIWTKDGSDPEIASAVDEIMTALGFRYSNGADLYEEDTEVFHKALRYTITKSEG